MRLGSILDVFPFTVDNTEEQLLYPYDKKLT